MTRITNLQHNYMIELTPNFNIHQDFQNLYSLFENAI